MDYSKLFPIRDYYNKYIVPINPGRYKETATTMVCPVHNDHDPSLGIIKSKSDGEICHCFGCNFWGNVVELHKRVNRRHFKKYLSDEEAKKELCGIFGVDYGSLPDEKGSRDKYVIQEALLDESINKFDISDFKYMLLDGKRKGKKINYFNTLLMVMTNEVKRMGLEDESNSA